MADFLMAILPPPHFLKAGVPQASPWHYLPPSTHALSRPAFVNPVEGALKSAGPAPGDSYCWFLPEGCSCSETFSGSQELSEEEQTHKLLPEALRAQQHPSPLLSPKSEAFIWASTGLYTFILLSLQQEPLPPTFVPGSTHSLV